MKLQNKKGFTLIELLVVITIIGILATGAVATYTSQIQKARDTTRVNDIKAVESAVQQSYGDTSQYPAVVDSGALSLYVGRIPQDQRAGQPGALDPATNPTTIAEDWNTLGYGYAVGDISDVTAQRFELSTAFENAANRVNRAADDKDYGNEPNRFEIGVPHPSGRLNLTTASGSYISN